MVKFMKNTAQLVIENIALRSALRPFAEYAERRLAKPIPNLGDSVHAIHTGTEWEAEIRFSDCIRAKRTLEPNV